MSLPSLTENYLVFLKYWFNSCIAEFVRKRASCKTKWGYLLTAAVTQHYSKVTQQSESL